jgi:hypothetical protein
MNDGVPLWLIRACWKILGADDIYISCGILGGLHMRPRYCFILWIHLRLSLRDFSAYLVR